MVRQLRHDKASTYLMEQLQTSVKDVDVLQQSFQQQLGGGNTVTDTQLKDTMDSIIVAWANVRTIYARCASMLTALRKEQDPDKKPKADSTSVTSASA
eukprot:10882506-Alexandrium_andersonii.AAC.1